MRQRGASVVESPLEQKSGKLLNKSAHVVPVSRGGRWTSLDASFAQCFAIFGNIVQNIARGTTDPWVDTITGGTL